MSWLQASSRQGVSCLAPSTPTVASPTRSPTLQACEAPDWQYVDGVGMSLGLTTLY